MHANTISTAKAFRFTGAASLVLGISTVLLASLAYAPGHPDFSIFDTYLSDIGDTPGWPQILFNTGALLAAPLRMVVLVLFAFRLRDYIGKQAPFEALLLTLGVLSTLGTVLMTAVPFSVAPSVHKGGIGLYFLGVVFLQALVGFKELGIKNLPRVLPGLSFSIVACYLVFFALFVLYQTGAAGRSTPVFWEWMCFFSSMAWLAGHSVILGKDETPAK
ncbi:MAG: hypothetical protein ACOYYU_06845 [Chloroflexota bacterium]